jgi:death-on-curing protein
MKTTLYPTFSEVIELHTTLIARFGGEKGTRDLGLLESALMRSQSGYYGSLSLEAAALLQSLASNHPFIDGNKRVAFAATAIFLRMNGYKLKIFPDKGERFIIDEVIKGRASIEVITSWLEKCMSAVDG